MGSSSLRGTSKGRLDRISARLARRDMNTALDLEIVATFFPKVTFVISATLSSTDRSGYLPRTLRARAAQAEDGAPREPLQICFKAAGGHVSKGSGALARFARSRPKSHRWPVDETGRNNIGR